ncbi:hypothetical protein ACFQFC_09705 [Amorphoplanes digitatis]|uniref:Uncharacterized protein n=1 Tax=Actinoplanes digitatis TaxID=1868 RepID=A0A7W7I151_9ACTN|nr:hypothetical protein [Actinoplanes digitatis]MBB4764470.1 hypothetical protein [Actinoplanes digitatis]GID94043.1 hypothetical protein Adi01nite_34550 [Actinoplanes digitatis]
MTTESISAGDDPRRLLSDVHTLARRVRLDQRVTWVALAVLAAVTFAGIPFDWFGMKVDCGPDDTCTFARRGVLYYWPVALLVAYAAIAFCYRRAARARGVDTRVLPYAVTGAVLTFLFTAVWIAAALYFPSHPTRFPEWALVFDRLITPWGTIGVALLVLARLERNLALLGFTLAYLAVVLVPIDFGWGTGWGPRTMFLPQQVINGVVLLVGAIGFAIARRRQR